MYQQRKGYSMHLFVWVWVCMCGRELVHACVKTDMEDHEQLSLPVGSHAIKAISLE